MDGVLDHGVCQLATLYLRRIVKLLDRERLIELGLFNAGQRWQFFDLELNLRQVRQ